MQKRKQRWLWSTVWFVCLLSGLVVLCRMVLYETYFIPSGSMYPTLEVGDRILVRRYLPVFRWLGVSLQPSRGSVVVFVPPCTPEIKAKHKTCEITYVKRVVGISGDRIALRNGQLFVNEQPVHTRPPAIAIADLVQECPSEACVRQEEELGESEHAILRSLVASFQSFGPVTVPEGHYFMMGDNRDNSRDSRSFGMIQEHAIMGEAVRIWYSVDDHGNTRWNRVGTAIH